MSLTGCITMCFIFYPAIFALSYFMRCRITFAFGIFALRLGSFLTHLFYYDKEFWYGWMPNWLSSAQIGFGYSALLSAMMYLFVFVLLVPRFHKMLERYNLQ